MLVGKGTFGRGWAGRKPAKWVCLLCRLANSFDVSGCGSTGNTRLSSDGIAVWVGVNLLTLIRLKGGSSGSLVEASGEEDKVAAGGLEKEAEEEHALLREN